MLADVLEGMRGRLVEELTRRLALSEPPSRSLTARRARLDRQVGQVIEALRRGGPDDATALVVEDPERELEEHEMVERFLLEQVAKAGSATCETDGVIARWRCEADRRCLREQTRRLGMLLDGVDEATAILAPDARILYTNRRASQTLRKLASVPRGAIVGRTPGELGLPFERLVGRPVTDLAGLGRAHASFALAVPGRANETQFDAFYQPDGSVSAVGLVVRDVFSRRNAQLRVDLLTKLGALVGVLDYDEVAGGLAGVPVPELADWCAFSVVEDERIRRTYLAFRDPSKDILGDAILKAAPPWVRHPLWQEMLTSGCQLLSEVSDDLLRKISGTEERYRLLSQLGVRSLMVVPLVTRAQVTGIMSLAYTTESGRRYGGPDTALAKELAIHAAHALENARLMRDLKASEARFRVALAGARTVVFEQDAKLRYTWYYNPLAHNGYAGKTPEEALTSDDASVLRTRKRRVLDQGEGLRDEVDLTLANNERRHYREAIEPMRDQTGKVVGIIGAATDITEQQAMKQQLSEDVSFRERMMSVLSHDLRNPLTTITVSGDLILRRADLPAPDRDQLVRIRRAADRMREMIETFLDFTRLRFGAFPMAFAPADLAEIARTVVDEARLVRPDPIIELRASGPTRGEWDSARLSQAIANLVGNALAYREPGTPVHLDVEGSDADVVVKVNNRGTPIPADLMAVIFEPFRRGGPQDRSPHGLGLGLHIVQQIALAHGGEIRVESNDQDGTTFTMRLPRARLPASPSPSPTGARRAHAGETEGAPAPSPG
jgi:signal transduction histidine kinase